MASTATTKNKRETLLSRSKRIIGKQLPRDARSDADDDDKPATGDVSKRRAQILKAQRTHRRRTQNYIQELEKEVLRLRAREAEMQSELESRSSQSRSHSHGLPSPSTSPQSNQSPGPSEAASVSIDLTEYAHVETEYGCAIQAALGPPAKFLTPPSDVTAHLKRLDIKNAGTSNGALCGMDAQAAINFILDLERPCLPHVKLDMTTKDDDPFKVPALNAGFSHACTASASIIHSHRHIDFAAQPFQIPVTEIDRLLESSKSLPLGPEMTPVQVWALLVNISSHQPITTAVFSTLKGELSKYMHCNAFGTTISIDILGQLLNFFFPWYSTAQLHDQLDPISQSAQQAMTHFLGSEWDQFF